MKTLEELAIEYFENSSIVNVEMDDIDLLTNYFDQLVVDEIDNKANLITKLTAENIKMKAAMQNMLDVFKENV